MQMRTSCVPGVLNRPGALLVLLAFALMACSSDSPSDPNGGNGDPVSAQAVAAGVFGVIVASDGFEDPDEQGPEASALGLPSLSMNRGSTPRYGAQLARVARDAEACSGGGTVEITEGPRNVGSPYANVLDVERVVGDDCRDDEGLSFIDGIIESGFAEPAGDFLYAVTYFRSSGLDGDPDSGSYAVQEIQLPEIGYELRFETRALAHACIGCSNPEHGGTFEQHAFMESIWTSHESDLTFRVGESTSQPYRSVIIEDAANDLMEMTLSGRLGISQTDNPCSFDAHHQTVSPIILRGIHSDEPEFLAGVLDVADRDGAWAHRVEFEDGNVFIDGELVRLEDFEDCSFEFSAL
jgi:hypothetical protein